MTVRSRRSSSGSPGPSSSFPEGIHTACDGFADSEVLIERLRGASDQIAATVPSVGRIDLTNHVNAWVGTGWVVAPDVVVTIPTCCHDESPKPTGVGGTG